MNKISTNEGLELITIDQSNLENLPILSISFLANYDIQEFNQVRLIRNINSLSPVGLRIFWAMMASFGVGSTIIM